METIINRISFCFLLSKIALNVSVENIFNCYHIYTTVALHFKYNFSEATKLLFNGNKCIKFNFGRRKTIGMIRVLIMLVNFILVLEDDGE